MNNGVTYRIKGTNDGYDGRPLPWVEDHDTGQVVAFLFGRRTNESFRRLLTLLAKSGIEVSRWFTDYWCRAAGAGLLRLIARFTSSSRQRSNAKH
jgi:hypothetical protein